jgi:hypothetical protein
MIREQSDDEPRPHRGTLHRRHHRAIAVDEVVDQVARLPPDGHPMAEVLDDVVDHVEVATGGERLVVTADDDDVHLRVTRDREPHIGEIPVHAAVGRIEPSGRVHDHLENARLRALEADRRELLAIALDHHPLLLRQR